VSLVLVAGAAAAVIIGAAAWLRAPEVEPLPAP
jgi:hypothetical protein